MDDREVLIRVRNLLKLGQLSSAVKLIEGHLASSAQDTTPVVESETPNPLTQTLPHGAVPSVPDAGTLFGPQCQQKRMKLGLAYPRTCRVCGLGPCKEPADA